MTRRRRIAVAATVLAVAAYLAIPRPDFSGPDFIGSDFTGGLTGGVSFSTAVYDKNGELLRLTLSDDDKYRLYASLGRFSPELVEATLLHEDRYFRAHFGVNPISLVRAAWQSYVSGGRRVGASTITMQLARIRFRIDSRTVGGKLLQIARALQIERHYSKDEILEAYLNLVPYGRNIEGAAAASLVYFQKPAHRLTLGESLTLAVIPQSPARRGPLSRVDRGNRELTGARAALFERWTALYREEHWEEPGEDRHASAMLDLAMEVHSPRELSFEAPHFVDALLASGAGYGSGYGGGYGTTVRTTLDLSTQRLLERRLESFVEQGRAVGIVNASAMLLDYPTMELRALVGSVDFFNDAISGQVNGAAARRSPGSTLKPFVYGLGMDQSVIHPLTMLKDAPMAFSAFNPENFDHDFVGPVKARDALVKSRNIPALQVASNLSGMTLYGMLKEAGVGALRDEEFYGLAVVLGGVELTMEELVALYAMLANGGEWRPIRKVEGEEEGAPKRLLSAEAAYLVLDMLGENPRPGRGFRKEWTGSPVDVYWKTGTSYAYRDAWAVGIAGPYVLAVWVGNFDGEGNPAFVGRTAAAPLFFEILDALKSRGGLDYVHKRGLDKLTKVEVCSVSGQLPTAHCPHTVSTWFIPGKSPIDRCMVHRPVAIDRATGLRACAPDAEGAETEVYEFWPSDLLKVFARAGLPRRTPPPYDPSCAPFGWAQGAPPRIMSPRKSLVYMVRAGSAVPIIETGAETTIEAGGEEKIALSAVTDADSSELYWFLDESFLGTSEPSRPFFWTPRSGTFVVRVVDDHGRSDARELKVVVVE